MNNTSIAPYNYKTGGAQPFNPSIVDNILMQDGIKYPLVIGNARFLSIAGIEPR
jgi:hypothetical protein